MVNVNYRSQNTACERLYKNILWHDWLYLAAHPISVRFDGHFWTAKIHHYSGIFDHNFTLKCQETQGKSYLLWALTKLDKRELTVVNFHGVYHRIQSTINRVNIFWAKIQKSNLKTFITLRYKVMMVTDLLQVVPTRPIQAARNKLLYQLVLLNLYTTCYVKMITDLLVQLLRCFLGLIDLVKRR
jgi:hypothetical protein